MAKPTDNFIVNTAFRKILTAYGKERGYDEFIKKKDWEDILKKFHKKCCYCGGSKNKELEADHIIGMNRSEMGLDCKGNIAPACPSCNKKKNNLSTEENESKKYGWERHLEKICSSAVLIERKKLIRRHMKDNKYPLQNLEKGEAEYKRLQEIYADLEQKIKKKLNDAIKKANSSL